VTQEKNAARSQLLIDSSEFMSIFKSIWVSRFKARSRKSVHLHSRKKKKKELDTTSCEAASGLSWSASILHQFCHSTKPLLDCQRISSLQNLSSTRRIPGDQGLPRGCENLFLSPSWGWIKWITFVFGDMNRDEHKQVPAHLL
jgi:hypothetical protein